MTKTRRPVFLIFLLGAAGIPWVAQAVVACTGITLRAKDGTVVFGRTMEWGSFDLRSRVVVIPRGHKFTAKTPDGADGHAWNATFGVVGLDAVGKDMVIEGMNEKGLAVGLFYHPGYAEYQTYLPARANESLAPTDVGTYLITTCATVDEAKAAIGKVRVVPLVEEALGIVPGVHYIVTEPSGKAIVIEYLKGERKVFDAPLGTITNSPSYDWHETNLRNYINRSAVALPEKKLGDLDFAPLGGGSGMIGLPGDFTPPSRFVRAVAFSKSARPTSNGPDAMYEIFRILDNFNVPLGAAEGSGGDRLKGMLSSTQWTTCSDTKNRVIYYHTQHNRRVRKLDLKNIDFTAQRGLLHLPLDRLPMQDIEELTPGK